MLGLRDSSGNQWGKCGPERKKEESGIREHSHLIVNSEYEPEKMNSLRNRDEKRCGNWIQSMTLDKRKNSYKGYYGDNWGNWNMDYRLDDSTILISWFWSLHCGYTRECPSKRRLISAVKGIREFYTFLATFKFETISKSKNTIKTNSLYSLARWGSKSVLNCVLYLLYASVYSLYSHKNIPEEA